MPKKVLVVDDEDNVRRLIVVTLGPGAYELLQARDGLEALALAERERPDLVLLDVSMPGLDGIEVCRRIRASPDLSGTVVVMLTAQAHGEVERRALAAGADSVLTKPFSPVQLYELVGRKLDAGR